MPDRQQKAEANREEALRILRQRASALSQPRRDSDASESGMNVVVLPLGSESYAFPASVAHEVQPLQQWAKIPGSPPYCVGIANIRSRIFPIIDVRHFLGVPMAGPTKDSFVVLVDVKLESGAYAEIAVLCDSRPGVRSIPLDTLKLWRVDANRSDEGIVKGVADDFVILLDTEKLLAGGRADAAGLAQSR